MGEDSGLSTNSPPSFHACLLSFLLFLTLPVAHVFGLVLAKLTQKRVPLGMPKIVCCGKISNLSTKSLENKLNTLIECMGMSK